MKLHLGENIRENRRRMGLTQEQLADRLGVSFQSVSRWENGTTYPDMEKLPEIARLFDTTIDALMGYEEKEEKIPIKELDQMYAEAVGREDWEECANIIRKMRYEYFEEIDSGQYAVYSHVQIDDSYKRDIIKNELRLLAETYLEKGKNGRVRAEMIGMMNRIEDEDKIADFLERYASHGGVSTEKYKLLEQRYWILKDCEKHDKYSLYNKFSELEKFLFPQFVQRNKGNAEKWLECTKANIALLNSLSGVTTDEKHPITGDGVIDLFSIRRMDLGDDYVTQLCGCGRYEEALTAMEDIADCIEKLAAIGNHSEKIPIRCPIFEGMDVVKVSGRDKQSGMIGCINFTEPWRQGGDHRTKIYDYDILFTGSMIRWFTTANFANVRNDTKWLDPVRYNPRYTEAVGRMIDACLSNHQKNDNWFYEDMSGFEAYNRGRKAIGKEERRPSH